MWRCVIAVTWVACSAAADAAEDTLYKKPGQDVVLKPISVPDSEPIKTITWKHNGDLAIELERGITEAYREFKARGTLNTANAELTIVKLAANDSGTYAVEINDGHSSQTHLKVITAVPVPTVVITCDDPETRCKLDCVGSTAGAEPVGYNWKLGDLLEESSTKEYYVKKEDISNVTKFSCELHNPVSKESSPLLTNPFFNDPTGEDQDQNMKIYTGLIVFITLLSGVVLLVSVHRCKTGMCFYEKSSMPWETDFWQKQRPDASVSNGEAPRQQEEGEEETPLA